MDIALYIFLDADRICDVYYVSVLGGVRGMFVGKMYFRHDVHACPHSPKVRRAPGLAGRHATRAARARLSVRFAL